jgi:hypothetical protein
MSGLQAVFQGVCSAGTFRPDRRRKLSRKLDVEPVRDPSSLGAQSGCASRSTRMLLQTSPLPGFEHLGIYATRIQNTCSVERHSSVPFECWSYGRAQSDFRTACGYVAENSAFCCGPRKPAKKLAFVSPAVVVAIPAEPACHTSQVAPPPCCLSTRSCLTGTTRKRRPGMRTAYSSPYSDLREAMSMEKRYFTSDLSSLS